ncbi:MAG: hypothetical protein Harvfovirus14_31 [Harvfovirus sp.]|uniref:Uncharacterized protein n=1 Tax=Harvfovirus sp. TaxID=2487768 RepID=A0A3G5A1P7_9VIRU|nr:MAG: hypothetical protein Harvfovirus14_31 [Harvfovirus sp.]
MTSKTKQEQEQEQQAIISKDKLDIIDELMQKYNHRQWLMNKIGVIQSFTYPKTIVMPITIRYMYC